MSRRKRLTRRARSRADERKPDALALYDPERMTPAEAIIATARAQGCTCKPEVTIDGVRAFLRHDDWCALLRKQDVN
jgi:hypothetical protein